MNGLHIDIGHWPFQRTSSQSLELDHGCFSCRTMWASSGARHAPCLWPIANTLPIHCDRMEVFEPRTNDPEYSSICLEEPAAHMPFTPKMLVLVVRERRYTHDMFRIVVVRPPRACQVTRRKKYNPQVVSCHVAPYAPL